jgi:hypothetical protein
MLTVVAVHNLLDSLFVHGIPAHLGVVFGAALAADASAHHTSAPDKDDTG